MGIAHKWHFVFGVGNAYLGTYLAAKGKHYCGTRALLKVKKNIDGVSSSPQPIIYPNRTNKLKQKLRKISNAPRAYSLKLYSSLII